jgi:bifunctional UDP-N-acetylglucosamine pyrophosphorylase / glucosamine-1-phosphate N-acetyltransferase
MPDLHVVVLAAGKGTRMRSSLPKVLHRAAGLPLIDYILRAAESLRPTSLIVVVGYEADQIREALGTRPGLAFVVQEPQLGTGHALLQTKPLLENARGTLLLLSGDVPLLRRETIERLVRTHESQSAAATVLTAVVDNPTGYGRVLRENGAITEIIEHKDATADQRLISEINSGVYTFDLAPLFAALKSIGSTNAQGEYYLPDLVRMYRTRGLTVETVKLADRNELLGVNSRRELADVATILRSRKNDELMAAGVTLVDPASAYIDPDVTIGGDTIIHPGVFLEGRTRIGANCEIHSGVRLVNTTVDDDAVIHNFCVIFNSHIASGAQVGPFAHLRPDSHVGEQAKVGNFVELKKTTLGRGSKASHLSYLGDSTIGERVNIGAGTITCNYDGIAKHPTVIEDGAFIGSDSQLIAPVRVGKGAYVAAGSSITEDVPAESLAIARSKQVNKEGWTKSRRQAQKAHASESK